MYFIGYQCCHQIKLIFVLSFYINYDMNNTVSKFCKTNFEFIYN